MTYSLRIWPWTKHVAGPRHEEVCRRPGRGDVGASCGKCPARPADLRGRRRRFGAELRVPEPATRGCSAPGASGSRRRSSLRCKIAEQRNGTVQRKRHPEPAWCEFRSLGHAPAPTGREPAAIRTEVATQIAEPARAGRPVARGRRIKFVSPATASRSQSRHLAPRSPKTPMRIGCWPPRSAARALSHTWPVHQHRRGFRRDHVPPRGVGTALLSRVGCSIRRPLLAG